MSYIPQRHSKYRIVFLIFLIISSGVHMGLADEGEQQLGLKDGHLQECPKSPNCLCSESSSGSHFIEPFAFSTSPAKAWQQIKQIIVILGGTIDQADQNYLHAIFTTSFFGFIDDLELRMDAANHLIQVRSASRVGYYDFRANKKRIERIRKHFHIPPAD